MILLTYCMLILNNKRRSEFASLLALAQPWQGKSVDTNHGIKGVFQGVQWINHSIAC